MWYILLRSCTSYDTRRVRKQSSSVAPAAGVLPPFLSHTIWKELVRRYIRIILEGDEDSSQTIPYRLHRKKSSLGQIDGQHVTLVKPSSLPLLGKPETRVYFRLLICKPSHPPHLHSPGCCPRHQSSTYSNKPTFSTFSGMNFPSNIRHIVCCERGGVRLRCGVHATRRREVVPV